MSGHFEVFTSHQGGFRSQLLDSSGNLVATSATFPTIRAAAALVREIAGTGLIGDMSRGHSGEINQSRIRPKQATAT